MNLSGRIRRTVRNRRWHRGRVGGLWDEVGRLQFDFLVRQGLRPEHYLLDVGCGSLRGGVHFVRYLEPGHYYGVDKDRALLDAGHRVELRAAGLQDRRPVLVQMEDFGFERLGRAFDVALAQSVFTHLPLNDVIRCLVNVERVLAPGGRFYATFFENPHGLRHLDPIHQGPPGPHDRLTYPDRDPFHYPFETFQWVCRDLALQVEYMGAWGHPRNQKMLCVTKRTA